MAYGPDYIHLTQADVGNIKPNLSTVFTVRAIEAGVNWESVFHEQTSNLRELQVEECEVVWIERLGLC